jgi:flagellar motor switch protein FliG
MGTRSGDLDPAVVLYLVKDLHMDPDAADDLLNKESGLQGLCGVRDMRDIEEMQQSSEAARMAVDVFVYRLQKYIGAYTAALGGVQAIVNILNTVDRGTEKYIMETLEIEDTDLAEEIRKRMFVFEDILSLDNRSIQRFLRDVENNQLAIALKGATEEV